MDRLDKAIADVAYILDTLMAYRNIVRTGDCNRCKIKKECGVCPKPGEQVRYNFYDYTSPYTDISKPSEMSISIRWDANVQVEYLLIYGKMPSNNWLRLHGFPMRRRMEGR